MRGRPWTGLRGHRPVPAMHWPGWEPTRGTQLLARASATSSHIDVTLHSHSMGGQGKHMALNHPTAAAENRHSNTHSPARIKISSSFLGRKWGSVFVGFYSTQENKAQGNKGGFVVGVVLPFMPLCKTKATRPPALPGHSGQEAVVPPLETRFIRQYLCPRGVSRIISWIPTTQLTRRRIRQRVITFTQETLTTSNSRHPHCKHILHI